MNKRAISTIEYMMLIMLIIGALIWMKPYMQRAIQGQGKTAGDSFGFSRQYERGQVADCAYAVLPSGQGVWYDDTCYQFRATNCLPGDTECENTMRQQCAQAYCCEEPSCN